MIPEELELRYQRQRPLLNQLQEEAEYVLRHAIVDAEIKFHAFLSRVKELDSVMKKAERLGTDDPYSEIVDLVGLRVVCLLRSDIPSIGEIIRNVFHVISEDNKIEGRAVSSFGYQSVHFTAKLNPKYSGPRYDPIKDIKFEIQLRTVAMDAWAIVSHYLDYKTEHDVPLHLRKDFYALSGLFYVVDTHFEMFYQAGKDNKDAADKRIASGGDIKCEKLNIDTFRAFIKRKIKDHPIPDDDADGYSEVVGELAYSGYRDIAEIDVVVDRGWNAFLEYEKEYPPHSTSGRKYNAIGVIRGLFSIVDEKYRPHRHPKPSNWDRYDEFQHLVRPT